MAKCTMEDYIKVNWDYEAYQSMDSDEFKMWSKLFKPLSHDERLKITKDQVQQEYQTIEKERLESERLQKESENLERTRVERFENFKNSGKNKEIINFLNKEIQNEEINLGNPNDKGFVTKLLEKFVSKYNEEEEKVTKLQGELLSKDATLTDKQESLIKDIEDKLFSEANLSEENKEKLSHFTGREKAGLAGLVWAGITGAMQIHTQSTGSSHMDINSLFSKWIKDPVSMLAMGNIIYKATKDFEDGASVSEIFGFITQGSISLFSGAKFINTFLEAKQATLINGKTFLETLKETYTTSNVLEPKYKYGYIFDTNTKELASTRFLSEDLSDIIASSTVEGTVPTLDGIRGRYIHLNGEEAAKGIGNLDAPNLPKESLTPDAPKSSGKVLGAIGIGIDMAWVATAISNVVENKDNLKPSQIMDLVGSLFATIGDFAGLVGGPIGELAGMIVSGLGSVISAAGGLADLNSESTPKEIANTVGDFLLSMTNPLLPSSETIETAIKFQKLKDNADNEIDKAIYGAFHKIASLDATPILNMTHGLYDQGIRNDLMNEFKDKFGSFDNMMTKYIREDTKFSENLDKVAGFLKNNAHTDHTQYITAYLAPEQIKEIFGKEQDYHDGYDIRNIDTDLQVKGEQKSEGYYELITKSGLEILPPGANLIEDGDKLILDTISLGYGKGNETIKDKDGNDISNPRVIDTATLVSYSASQLRSFRDKFRSEHTHNIYKPAKPQCTMVPGAAGVPYRVCTTQNQKTLDRVEVDEGYENPKLWLNLVDDMSGIQIGKKYEQLTPEDWNQFSTQQKYKISRRDDMDAIIPVPLKSVNNRVITTVSDSLFPNINVGKGDDDVSINNVERIYSGSESVLRAIADGGEGMDILDMSKVTEDLNGEYSINDSKLSFKRDSKDGKDYDLEFSNFEQVILGSAKNEVSFIDDDTITGDERPTEARIIGIKGIENKVDGKGIKGSYLYFQGNVNGKNLVEGTENNDVITVLGEEGKGDATLYGYGGNDIIIGGDLKTGKNSIYGGDGADFIKANGSNNIVFGGSGADFILGSDKIESNGNNLLDGGDDNDLIVSGKAGAQLNGQNGNDILIGNIGEDTLVGGNGDDILIGGEGKDSFQFSSDFGKDIIKDFNSGETLSFIGGNNSLDELEFIENQEDDYLAITDGENCIKLLGFKDDYTLNIRFQGYKSYNVPTTDEITNRIKNAISFEDYKKAVIPHETAAASPVPSMYGSQLMSYSTQNQYSEVFSSQNSGQTQSL